MKKDIIVIGGGASGLIAAITAARTGAEVLIIEHKEKVGKKILATGNGRCNYTNLNQQPEFYYSEDRTFPTEALARFSAADTLAFFEELGIAPRERDGYVYPASGQAASVCDALLLDCQRQKVMVLCGVDVKRIEKKADGFVIEGISEAGTKMFQSKAVILAAGSKASPVTGSDGSGYQLAKALGHKIIEPLPSLVQLRAKEKFFKQVAGVRIQGEVRLVVDGEQIAKDVGEIQLTNYGISGIPVFQVSRFAAKGIQQHQHVQAVLDFMPERSFEAGLNYLMQRQQNLGDRTNEHFLTGLFPSKMNALFLKLAELSPHQPVVLLSPKQLKKLTETIKQFKVAITAANPFANAQVCSGGVSTSEINRETMASLLVQGLFLAGEIIDVDGICGGYNLQWAWSSGYLAGQSAALQFKKNGKRKL